MPEVRPVTRPDEGLKRASPKAQRTIGVAPVARRRNPGLDSLYPFQFYSGERSTRS